MVYEDITLRDLDYKICLMKLDHRLFINIVLM